MDKALKLTSFDTKYTPRPHVNTLVRLHHTFTPEERLEAAHYADWNVFRFPSEMLAGGDLLSDSGTTTLTSEQFSAMILGDEAYGSNWGYFKLLESMGRVFGLNIKDWEIYFFHQGRAAEHALFSHIKGDNLVIPANSFFDTTRANTEANNIKAVDLLYKGLKSEPKAPFKGNMNLEELEKLLKTSGDSIPLVYTTITNNTGGGQPVAMENIKAVKALCDEYKKPFFLDACRFAENAWFIKEREKEYKNTSIADIAKEEFSLCDGFTISFKKDGLANMGGALAIRKDSPLLKRYPTLLENVRDHQILVEGHPTYGGLTGRDIMTIVVGLDTVVEEAYLKGRIKQVQAFGDYLSGFGIPLVEPFGGHAIYIDTDEFFKGTKIKKEDFGGIALTGLLLLKGVRLCELGAFAFGTYDPKTKKETFPAHNFVRAAIPRNKYELQDLYYVADCIKGLYDQRDNFPKAVPIFGKDKTLRHFKARFELTDT